MKFSCNQNALVKALNTVDKAVSARTTIPVLKGILLNVKEGKLFLTASDMDLSIETSIDVINEEEGSTVVGAKLFEDIIRKLPNASITFEENSGRLNIGCLGSSFTLVTMSADEYPSIGMVNQLNKIEISKDIFIDIVKKTSFAASIDEKKGVLTGCLMQFNEDKLEVAAIDGFRMAVAETEASFENKKNVVIPARMLNEIVKILTEYEDNKLSLILDEKRAEIILGATRIVARLLDGEFIQYKDIIPKEHKTRFISSRADLINAIERASLLSSREGKNNLIKFNIKDGQIEISSRSEEGNVVETVLVEKEGEDLEIGFNSKYVMDALKAASDEDVAFELTSALSACIIKPVEGNSYTYLVLPVRISA